VYKAILVCSCGHENVYVVNVMTCAPSYGRACVCEECGAYLGVLVIEERDVRVHARNGEDEMGD
jgi:hypothetical protein